MEADSTTFDTSPKEASCETRFPFIVSPENHQLYDSFTTLTDDTSLERQIVEKLQSHGLLQKTVNCPTGKPECKVECKKARVIDRVQWVCSGCGSRQSVRQGSLFQKLQCSLLQALQVILAWSEDADCALVAEHYGVKPRVVNLLYNKLDELAAKEQSSCRLGGGGSVVLAALYPACVDRLSPDTTAQPHRHSVLMLADTNLVPTRYWLHVIKDDNKKTPAYSSMDHEHLKAQIEEVVKEMTLPDSLLVSGWGVPALGGATSTQHLFQHCDHDMQQFLSSRIWRRAVSLCAASRSLCAGAAQRYLGAALFARAPPCSKRRCDCWLQTLPTTPDFAFFSIISDRITSFGIIIISPKFISQNLMSEARRA
ncbi:hypothetical protein MSG28_003240 [Choristoneura fumiferana]|uniref:Uncharacterized protein n=1 Tax=Choristoneura fumiferana TaxID=7141 RepID=A0ACC0KE49_CHOFU|nr:hypothetical protein MSG28_003240 [Choristoneura fumiferana]